ncbi:MAG TPA: response regulator transcription factor [Thermomicrobiales bacterium]|jgi:two-component system, OmpR family, KDP operon response regulator KdpE
MSAPPIRVLVVDDEPQILRALRAALKGHGYDVQTAADGEEALDALALHPPDIVILDLVMPGKSGFDVVREVRGWSQSAQRTPAIIVLSARGEDRDKVTALDLGADDYLTKPFSMNELLARIRVALRHRPEQAAVGPVIDAGPVTIDLARRVVTRDGAEVHLTPTEWQLLAELAREAGKVLTQRMLLQRVWGPEYADEAQYLRVYINQLRRKLEADPPRPRILITEPGVGYRFIADED